MTASISHLELEIRAQGRVLAERTEAGWESASRAAVLLRRDDVDHVVIAARGTSDNAGRYAQYLLGLEARLPVGLATPWLYERETPPRISRGAVLAISQSGRSPDILAVAGAARAQRRPTIALTNDADSPLAAACDVVVPIGAGPELAVPATKTYLASLHAIAQIAACVSGTDDEWFARAPELVYAAAETELATRSRFDPLARAPHVTVVGRGLQFATAHETALKLRELSAIPTEAFSPPDLLHGPIAAVGPETALWLIESELQSRAGLTVAVSSDPRALAAADIAARLPTGLPPWLSPLIAVIPGQAAALRLGELAGVALDHPHGLHKVTLTT